MFLLLTRPRRLVLPTLLRELSGKRNVQELPGRVKVSSSYLRKVSFLFLLHQSGLHQSLLCLCLIPPFSELWHPKCSLQWSPASLPVVPACFPGGLCPPLPAARQLPPCLWYCGDAIAQHSGAAAPPAPFPGCGHLGVPLSCPEVPAVSPAPAALPPFDVWVPARAAVAVAVLRGTAAFCDSTQLLYWAQSKQNETVIKIYEIIVSQKPTEKEKW